MSEDERKWRYQRCVTQWTLLFATWLTDNATSNIGAAETLRLLDQLLDDFKSIHPLDRTIIRSLALERIDILRCKPPAAPLGRA
jgi:hypothetical protein